jgi:hypothetical protein
MVAGPVNRSRDILESDSSRNAAARSTPMRKGSWREPIVRSSSQSRHRK